MKKRIAVLVLVMFMLSILPSEAIAAHKAKTSKSKASVTQTSKKSTKKKTTKKKTTKKKSTTKKTTKKKSTTKKSTKKKSTKKKSTTKKSTAKKSTKKKTTTKKSTASRGDVGRQERVIRVAMSLVGAPYKWSGTTPKGFDCSGFTRYVYNAGAGVQLPHSSAAQAQLGSAVSKDILEPGDIVYFNTSGSGVSHVGIYIGGDNFISATNGDSGVRVSSLSSGYWAARYMGARRIL